MTGIEMLANPAITMGVSAVTGFLMKLRALENDRRQQERLQTIDAFKVAMRASTSSANAAVDRINSSWGKVTRRFIAWALVLAVIALVFVPGFIDKPSVVETVRTSGGWIFGLIPERTRTEFVSLQGFVHMPALIVGFGHVVAFYFGQGAAKP